MKTLNQYRFFLQQPLLHFLFVLSGIFAIPNSLAAQDRWIDSGGGYWDDDYNWEDLSDPGPLDAATFDLNAPYAVTWDGFTGDTESYDLRIVDGNVTFRSQGGLRTHSVTGTSNARISIEDGARLNLGSSLSDAFHLRVSDDAIVRANGTLNINEGSTLTTLGLGSTVSGMVVTGWDPTITESGVGRANILSGGQIYSVSGSVQGDPATRSSTGGEAYARISGAGSLWNADFFSIGSTGIGEITIEEQGRLDVGWTNIGINNFGDGTANVTGSGSVWTAHEVSLGRKGKGTINVRDDGFVSMIGSLKIGLLGGSGTVVVADEGSYANVVNAVKVFGTGEIQIKSGGWMTAQAIDSTPQDGLTSTIMVDGPTSRLETSEGLNATGNSFIQVQNGGHLSNDYADIYSTSLGVALMDVGGANSNWIVSSNLKLGLEDDAGSAAIVKVTDGGQVSVGENTFIHSGSLLILADSRFSSADMLVNGYVLSDGNVLIEGNLETSGVESGMLFGNGPTEMAGDLIHNGPQIKIAVDGQLIIYGTASGEGKFAGTGTTRFEGVLSPGNGPAIIEFEGDVEMGDVAISEFELAGQSLGNFDRLQIKGDFHADGELQIAMPGGLTLEEGMAFELINIGGKLTGSFDGLGEGDVVHRSGKFDLRISYKFGDGNDIGLIVIGS